LLFLGPITAILTYRYERIGAAFSLGILSHLITDSLVGTIPILYPISNTSIGLNLGIPSPADTVLEVGALAATILLVFQNGDYVLFTQARKESVLIVIPLTAIVTLTLLFAGDNAISLTALAFSRKALTTITVGHVILITTLTIGTMQGLRSHMTRSNRNPSITSPAAAHSTQNSHKQ